MSLDNYIKDIYNNQVNTGDPNEAWKNFESSIGNKTFEPNDFNTKFKNSYQNQLPAMDPEEAWQRYERKFNRPGPSYVRIGLVLLFFCLLVSATYIFKPFSELSSSNSKVLTNSEKSETLPKSPITDSAENSPIYEFSLLTQDQGNSREVNQSEYKNPTSPPDAKVMNPISSEVIAQNFYPSIVDQNKISNLNSKSSNAPNHVDQKFAQKQSVKLLDVVKPLPPIKAWKFEDDTVLELKEEQTLPPIINVVKSIGTKNNIGIHVIHTWLDHKYITSSNTAGIGLSSDFFIKKSKWFLNTGLNWNSVNYSSFLYSKDLRIQGLNFDEVLGDLKNVNYNMSMIDLGLGLNRIWQVHNNYSIYLGTGIVQRLGLNNNIVYQFEGGENIELSINKIYRYPIYTNIRMGVQYSINQRYLIDLIGQHSRVIQNASLIHPNFYSLSLSFKVKF